MPVLPTMNLADTIIMFVGFYFLISTAMMKVHGRINRMMAPKKYDPQKARDLPRFIASMYVPNIVIGIITMTVGAAHYILADVLGKEQIGLARAQKNICLPIEPDDARGACAWQAGPVCQVVPPGEQADMMDEEDRKNDSAAEIFAALSFVVNTPCL